MFFVAWSCGTVLPKLVVAIKIRTPPYTPTCAQQTYIYALNSGGVRTPDDRFRRARLAGRWGYPERYGGGIILIFRRVTGLLSIPSCRRAMLDGSVSDFGLRGASRRSMSDTGSGAETSAVRVMAGYISERGWLVGWQQAACWRHVPCARREERAGGDTCGTVGAPAQGLAAANDTTTGLLTPGALSGSPQDLATGHGLPLWRIRQPGPLVRQRISQNSSPVSQAVNSPARRRRLAGMSSARPVPRLKAIAGSRLCC